MLFNGKCALDIGLRGWGERRWKRLLGGFAVGVGEAGCEAGGLGGLPVAQVWDRQLQWGCLWGPTDGQLRSPKIAQEIAQNVGQISTGPLQGSQFAANI